MVPTFKSVFFKERGGSPLYADILPAPLGSKARRPEVLKELGTERDAQAKIKAD